MGLNGKECAAFDGNRVADSLGAPMFCFHKAVVSGTTAYTVVADLEFPVRVIGVRCYATAAAGGGTVVVNNGSNAITGTIAMNTDTEVTGDGNLDGAGAPLTMDNTYWSVAKHGSITLTTANNPVGDVFVWCVKEE